MEGEINDDEGWLRKHLHGIENTRVCVKLKRYVNLSIQSDRISNAKVVDEERHFFVLVLSDSDSNSTTRPSTAESVDMPKRNLSSGRSTFLQNGRTSTVEFLDHPSSSAKKVRHEKSIKVLVFNGKCSNAFKSTLEECVEDCILEFPYENNSVYVPKSGPAIPVPIGSNRQSLASTRESSPGRIPSSRRRNSITQPTMNVRNSATNHFSLPTTALAVSTVTRMRHPHVQQRFILEDDISEESSEQRTMIEQIQLVTNIESEEQSKHHPSAIPDERISPNIAAFSLPVFPSSKCPMPYQERQKDYRLSDLVMYGPEYFAHIFNLPRTPSRPSSRRRNSKTNANLTELDRIKQDLFHRYLWTKNPQVSSRIRPLSAYTRSSTFVR